MSKFVMERRNNSEQSLTRLALKPTPTVLWLYQLHEVTHVHKP